MPASSTNFTLEGLSCLLSDNNVYAIWMKLQVPLWRQRSHIMLNVWAQWPVSVVSIGFGFGKRPSLTYSVLFNAYPWDHWWLKSWFMPPYRTYIRMFVLSLFLRGKDACVLVATAVTSGVATGWAGVDMSTPLLPAVVTEIDVNLVEFCWWTGEGVGVKLVKFL
jgi:hypothetical protein